MKNNLLLIGFLVWAFPTTAAMVTVGNAPNCNYQSLQDAIDDSLSNADAENELRLVNDASHNHQSYHINFTQDKILTIKGGYQSCDDANHNIITGKSVIDAQDTQITASIFTVDADSVITPSTNTIVFENLVLTGSRADMGAAIASNKVNVTLKNLDLINNQAQFGGALSCSDGGGLLALQIFDTVFSNNIATSDGGALYLHRNVEEGNQFTGGCYTIFNSQNRQSLIDNNHADNNGGGIYVTDMSDEVLFANVTTDANFSSLIISNNSAINGGGIYQISGRGAMYGIKFVNNQASQLGGALYLGGTELTGDFLAICGDMINNVAGVSGGAVYADYFTFATRPSNGGQCKKSLIQNNSAPNAAFIELVNGALLFLGFGGTTTVENHVNAHNLIKSSNSSIHSGRIDIQNSVIHNNSLIDNLLDIDETETWIRHNLIADNQVNENIIKKNGFVAQRLDRYFFNTIAGNTIGLNVLNAQDTQYAIIDNIIWQNENTLFNLTDSSGDYTCNIVSSQADLFDGSRNTNVDPQFVNVAASNYHLKFSSRAIDYCSHNPHPFLLLNGEDNYDWQEIDNLYGEVDIGVYRYEQDIFKNSFE